MATRKYTHNTEIECTIPFNCDSKSYKGGGGGGGGGGTDTILYSQHATMLHYLYWEIYYVYVHNMPPT